MTFRTTVTYSRGGLFFTSFRVNQHLIILATKETPYVLKTLEENEG